MWQVHISTYLRLFGRSNLQHVYLYVARLDSSTSAVCVYFPGQ